MNFNVKNIIFSRVKTSRKLFDLLVLSLESIL
jgi:hypothetical protein